MGAYILLNDRQNFAPAAAWGWTHTEVAPRMAVPKAAYRSQATRLTRSGRCILIKVE